MHAPVDGSDMRSTSQAEWEDGGGSERQLERRLEGCEQDGQTSISRCSQVSFLVSGQRFKQMLRSGSLLDGLEVLAFHLQSMWSLFAHTLQPGVIPASPWSDSERRLVAGVGGGGPYWNGCGCIPSGRFAGRHTVIAWNLSGMLSPSTRLAWLVHQRS